MRQISQGLNKSQPDCRPINLLCQWVTLRPLFVTNLKNVFVVNLGLASCLRTKILLRVIRWLNCKLLPSSTY